MGVSIPWNEELETRVLDSIESGLTLRQVATQCNMSAAAIIRHVVADEQFAKQYARVMDIRTETDCSAIDDDLAQEPETTKFGVDTGWVAWKRLQIDTRKWLLSKRNPKKYGEKLQVDGDLKVTRLILRDEAPALPGPAPVPEFDAE